MKTEKNLNLSRQSHVIALITALSLLIVSAGYFYYRNEERTIRKEKENELKAIAELKIKQLADWYKDELQDASVISNNPFLFETIHNYLTSNKEKDKISILNYLNQIKNEHGYADVILTTTNGTLLASTHNKLQDLDAVVVQSVKQAVKQKTAFSTDLYRSTVHNTIQIDFISAILDNNNSAIAAIIFQMNPDDFLYPLLEFWPTPSKASETYIARKEEDSIVVLNKLRHIETPALDHKYSLNDKEAAIVKAVQGHTGFVDAVDYRGVNVMAYSSAIPGTPWFMVAKVDRTELFEVAYYKAAIILIFVILMILLISLGLSLIYRKKTEQSLRKSEARFRELFISNPHPMWVYDLDSLAFLAVNDAAISHYGYSRNEFLAMTIKDIRPVEDVPRLLENIELMRNGVDNAGIWRHIRKDGSIIEVEITSHALLFDQRRAEMVLAHDVTERRLAEASLAASAANFRRLSQEFHGLLDAIPDSLMLLNRDLKVLWVNRAAAENIGDNPEALAGRLCYGLWYGRTSPCEPCPILESFATGKRRSETITRPDGRIWDIRTVPLTDEQGIITNVIELKRDITEHRQIEEQFRHSQKLEGIGQLAGGIAHDFNNVLTAVVGFAGLLQMQMDKSDPLIHYADEIMAAGQRGAALTQQILALSRKQVLNMKPANLNEIIRDLEKMLQRLLREDISIKLNLFSKDLLIFADASQIDQVLINLATNARDAMPEGGKLSIATEPFVMDRDYVEMCGYGSPGEYALITISDTGCGMDPDTKSRIFEPFFTTKEVGRGTGLGLAVVHGIVKQHNGYIDIYSEVGKGTIFKIYLPLTEHASYETHEKHDNQIRGGTETVLIAEDDAALRALSRSVLSHYGYNVIDAVDGEDAVLKFDRNKDSIELVILDGIMPNMNGREAFDEIRKLCPDMKAIFMSGYAKDIFTYDGIPDRAAVFIQKPVTPNSLLRKVREALDRE